MIDIKHKNCITCNLIQPGFNYPNEKNPYVAMIVKMWYG